ncbi:MAG: hypothetical protein IKT39_02440 [Clostridia bacterium]|nr:hypothetical protein [Clostridia bacterium]
MAKTKLEFKESNHILEVDGVEYVIPQRTVAIDEKLREHDAKLAERTEYESNMDLLGIIFGEEAAHQMFPEGKETNLDKLSKCVRLTLSLFTLESSKTKQEEMNSKLEKIKPVIDITSAALDSANAVKKLGGKKTGKRK